MDRIQAACYALVGSALVLTVLLALQLPSLVSPAQAALVSERGRFTTLTARVNPGDDGLFVIDQRNEKLLIYYLNTSTNPNRLELGRAVDLTLPFAAPPPAPGVTPRP